MLEAVMNNQVHINNNSRQKMEGSNTEFTSNKIYMEISFLFVFL